MSFTRLSRWHALAAVAAVLLTVAMALDWYSSAFGEEARRIERIQPEPSGALSDEITRQVLEDASIQAEEEEQNAWQATGTLDRLVLALLLASVVLALAAAVLRAADRRYPPPLTPSVLTASVAAVAAGLVAVRILVEGADVGGSIEAGAPLGLLAVGLVALGAARAARVERLENERRVGTAS